MLSPSASRAFSLLACAAPVAALAAWVGLLHRLTWPPLAADDRPGLDPAVAALRARSDGKHEAVRALAAGRMTLREAAACFRDSDAQGPPAVYDRGTGAPGRSPEDRRCARVISWVRHPLREDPGREREVVARLEAERERLWRAGELGPPD